MPNLFRKQELSHQGTRSRVATKHDKRCALLLQGLRAKFIDLKLKRN